MHDQQEFTVEDLLDWGFDDDDRVIIRVRWLGFDASEDTWEPMSQLYEDVERKVRLFVEKEMAPQLSERYGQLVKSHQQKSKKKLKKNAKSVSFSAESSNPPNMNFVVRKRVTTDVTAPESPPPAKRMVSHDQRVADYEEKSAAFSEMSTLSRQIRMGERTSRAAARQVYDLEDESDEEESDDDSGPLDC